MVAWCRPNPPVGALGDKFRPATSYLTIACVSDRRYFDLDAVRTDHKGGAYDAGRLNRGGYQPRVGSGIDGVPLERNSGSNPAGAPPLDWWNIPTHPFSGAHYATFPPALCVKPILAMCPQRVCTVCGVPSVRIVKAVAMLDGAPLARSVDASARDKGAAHGFDHNRLTTDRRTLGWTDCGHGDQWRNGLVLDPFAGSGTTLAVASGHGRDAIGIDLDPRNADLAQQRVGMFLEVDADAGEPRA